MNCLNNCATAAQSIRWTTTQGSMTANFCGPCASDWWSKYKNTEAGLSATFAPPMSREKLAEACVESQSWVPLG